jgi:hypothetical protein
LCQPLPDFDQPGEDQALARWGDDGLVPHDYLVDHATQETDVRPVSDLVWQQALATAAALTGPPAERLSALWSIGGTAYNQHELEHSLTAMRALTGSGDTAVAVNLGPLSGEMGQPDEAIAAYDQVIDTYREDPAPALREQVADALVGKAFEVMGRRDGPAAAISVYDQVSGCSDVVADGPRGRYPGLGRRMCGPTDS